MQKTEKPLVFLLRALIAAWQSYRVYRQEYRAEAEKQWILAHCTCGMCTGEDGNTCYPGDGAL